MFVVAHGKEGYRRTEAGQGASVSLYLCAFSADTGKIALLWSRASH